MATKIMLVEDDTNLSSIYQARLEAEGFQIITAGDGEAALALAVKEHPDLIISDVMMPKISGFDMLDILRGTDGIKNTKVIMMTALGQAEDKARADKLGADRYLVKSQVTLEDVVRTVHEVLADQGQPPAAVAQTAAVPEPPAAAPNPEPQTTSIPVAEPPAEPTAAPVASDPAPAAAATIPVAEPPAEPKPDPASPVDNATPVPDQPAAAAAAIDTSPTPGASPTPALVGDQSSNAEQTAVLSQIEDFINKQETPSQTSDSSNAPVVTKKVIEPVFKAKPKHNLADLLAREQSTAPGATLSPSPGMSKSTDGFVPAEHSTPAGHGSSAVSALQPEASPSDTSQTSL